LFAAPPTDITALDDADDEVPGKIKTMQNKSAIKLGPPKSKNWL
jgi:hypothetical protein